MDDAFVLDAAAIEAAAVNPIHNVLALCGVATAAARATFINLEGLNSIDAFAMLNGDSDVTEMAKRMASRGSVAAGRVILGTMQIKRIQALVYWVKDHPPTGGTWRSTPSCGPRMRSLLLCRERKRSITSKRLMWISLILVSVKLTSDGMHGRLLLSIS